jgi:Mn-containing catalase
VRGGVHQVAYARALENLTGADLTKLFPSPRIPTEKVPSASRTSGAASTWSSSPDDYREIGVVWHGSHPETGDPLTVEDGPPEGALPQDLPAQPAVFAPSLAPEEITEIAAKLRKAAGLPDKPTGRVANEPSDVVGAIKDKVTR